MAVQFFKSVGQFLRTVIQFIHAVLKFLTAFHYLVDGLSVILILHRGVIKIQIFYSFFEIIIGNAVTQLVGVDVFLSLLCRSPAHLIILFFGHEDQSESLRLYCRIRKACQTRIVIGRTAQTRYNEIRSACAELFTDLYTVFLSKILLQHSLAVIFRKPALFQPQLIQLITVLEHPDLSLIIYHKVCIELGHYLRAVLCQLFNVPVSQRQKYRETPVLSAEVLPHILRACYDYLRRTDYSYYHV